MWGWRRRGRRMGGGGGGEGGGWGGGGGGVRGEEEGGGVGEAKDVDDELPGAIHERTILSIDEISSEEDCDEAV